MFWVGGADGYREGWAVALWQPATGTWRWRVIEDTAALFDLPEAPAQLALDMIVGLPDCAEPGGRSCDRAARRVLGHPRSSSVFSPPAYAALQAESYEEAQRINRASGPDAPGISIQAFNLFPKLRAVAEEMTPERQHHVREAHPELAFYAMNDGAPLPESKHSPEGQEQRLELLETNGCPPIRAIVERHASAQMQAHDVLDAHAVCWTARRIHTGEAERVPEPPVPRNQRGLHMEIWR
jgi:predicted RNase H-like nuclease